MAQQWIQQARILLLFDGLDELGQQNQVECINTLEDFLAQHPALPAIICCRKEEYEQGGEQLKQLNGAIYLQALELQKIQQYLKDLGQEQLWEPIQTNPELLKLAQSPLFLTMLVIAAQDQPIQDSASLFNAYIQKQLHEPSHQGTYKPKKAKSPEQTLHYLGWLARQLEKKKTTEFLIENLQPDCLQPKQYRTYKLITALFWGMFTSLLTGLFTVPSAGLFWGMLTGLFSGMIAGIIVGTMSDLHEIKLQEQLKWDLQEVLFRGLINGIFWGMIHAGLLGDLLSGLGIGLGIGLMVGLTEGLSDAAIEKKQIPNQGIKRSLQNGLIVALITTLLFTLAGGWFGNLRKGLIRGLFFGLFVGLCLGMDSGLGAALQHFWIRICLTKNGDTPWNYAKFLDHAARHRFIQRTGGRYRFTHDLLRQHFAQMTSQQQAALAQPSKQYE